MFLKSKKVELDNIPPYLDDKISNNIFKCNHKIWQAMIFIKFILNKRYKSVEINKIVKWVIKYIEDSYIKYNDNPYHKVELVNRYNEEDLTIIIEKYFNILVNHGYLREVKRDKKSVSYIILKDYVDLTEDGYYTVEEAMKRRLEREDKFKLSKRKEDITNSVLNGTRFATCKICGEYTSDWIILDGLTNTCSCSKCHYKDDIRYSK